VQDFLQQLGLDCYWGAFKEMGFDTVDTLQDITEANLNAMKVAVGHQGKLLRKIKELVKNL
jgi:hypothetical protein